MARFSLLAFATAITFTVGCGEIDEGPFIVDEDFDRMEVRLSNGDLALVHTDGDEAQIVADFGGLARPGAIGRYVKDGVLIVDYECALCGGEIVVSVPDGVPVEVGLSQGDLLLEGLSGRVLANVQAGAVEGIDLACDAQISTRMGSIELEYAFRPASVLVETTFGSIDLIVPPGAYDLSFGGNVGVVNLTGVEDDPDSNSRIAAFAEAGEISITGEEIVRE